MKIQPKSDLHMEFRTGDVHSNKHFINPDADVIVLAGDITNSDTQIETMIKLYSKATDVGKTVFYIPGNHEFYNNIFDDRVKQIHLLLADSPITFLDPRYIGDVVVNDYLFLGATLFTDLSNPVQAIRAQSGMNDFNQQIVGGSAPFKWTGLHAEHRQFLKAKLKDEKYKDLKKVVITHMLPLPESIPYRFRGHSLDCCYNASMEEFFHKTWSPDLWIHGHTHDSCDYLEGKTRVVCNPYGYDPNGVNLQFKKDLLVEV